MALFNSSSPAYKTANSPNAVYAPVAPSSGLAGLFGSLLGGSTPTYKTLDGQAGQASATRSSSLMRIFVGTDPTYKTAQLAADAVAVDNDDDDGACDEPIDTVVVL